MRDIFLKIICCCIPGKKTRKAIRKIFKILKEHERTARYLRDSYVLPYITSGIQYSFEAKKELLSQKIIWQYWGQGIENAPNIVKACMASVSKNKGDYHIIVLNNDNIKEYLDLPEFVLNKIGKEFTITFFSDLLRIALLSTYGGVWIDATILLTGAIDEKILNSDFFAFQRSKERPANAQFWIDYEKNYDNKYFGWDDSHKVRMLSSFIVAKAGNKLATALRDILLNFWRDNDKLPDYFLFQILFNELIQLPEYSALNCKITNDTDIHLLQAHRNELWTQELWDSITSKTSIHKLSYFNIEQSGRNSLLYPAFEQNYSKWIYETLINKHQDENRVTFMPYKNAFAGKDIVLLATGPSVKDFVPADFQNVIYVGVKGAILFDFVKLNFYFANPDNYRNYIYKAKDYPCEKFYATFTDFAIPEAIVQEHNAKRVWCYKSSLPDLHVDCFDFGRAEKKYIYELDKYPLTTYGSIVEKAMQFIFWGNPKRIYLVGCDCADVGKHFFEYDTRNHQEGQLRENYWTGVKRLRLAWQRLKEFRDHYYPETEIISVNPVGLKRLFTDLYQKKKR